MMRVAAVVVALFALGLAGCSNDDDEPGADTSSPDSTTSTSTSEAPAEPVVQAGDTYVALGSSIASGFGISEQSTSCGRSNRSYPNLVARRLELELVDVTCGAAQVRHVVRDAQGDNPPQLEALTPDTALVTVTVGGNDIGYNATAVGCGDPSGVCTAPPTLDADVAAAKAALLDMIDRIEAAAPEATIVFVTYPREVPPEGNCPELSFTDEEIAIVRDIGDRLQQIFLEVAAETDVVFVDPYAVEEDHTGCAPADERWVAGFEADDGFAYHPTALGHEAMADMILEAIGASG